MKKLIIIFSLITTNLLSQNRDSYLATSIEDCLYFQIYLEMKLEYMEF